MKDYRISLENLSSAIQIRTRCRADKPRNAHSQHHRIFQFIDSAKCHGMTTRKRQICARDNPSFAHRAEINRRRVGHLYRKNRGSPTTSSIYRSTSSSALRESIQSAAFSLNETLNALVKPRAFSSISRTPRIRLEYRIRAPRRSR